MSKKVLMRSSNAMIAGVCAGLAEYFDVDTTLMRIIAAIFLFATGLLPFTVVYFVMMIIMPKGDR
ncbi:MAG: PspC domain-containing protein [Paludibacteraceae bacterium]|nr:PspC domain-containing protein [Paludibacteraceae bacterium]MBQ5774851.1 PspC domain-containing protein [Paludibacteraceae bacterium]